MVRRRRARPNGRVGGPVLRDSISRKQAAIRGLAIRRVELCGRAGRVGQSWYGYPDLSLRPPSDRISDEFIPNEDGGGFHIFCLHHRVAYRHFSSVGGVRRL